MSKFYGNRQIWKTQPPIDYITSAVVNPIVINDWYTASSDLSGGEPARLWYVVFESTNNGATVEDIVLEITINGTAYTFTKGAAVSGTRYFGTFRLLLSGSDFAPFFITTVTTLNAPLEDSDHALPFEAESVGLIRCRQTTAVDVVSATLEVNMSWDKLTEV